MLFKTLVILLFKALGGAKMDYLLLIGLLTTPNKFGDCSIQQEEVILDYEKDLGENWETYTRKTNCLLHFPRLEEKEEVFNFDYKRPEEKTFPIRYSLFQLEDNEYQQTFPIIEKRGLEVVLIGNYTTDKATEPQTIQSWDISNVGIGFRW